MRDLIMFVIGVVLLYILYWFFFIFPGSYGLPYICNKYEDMIKELSNDESFQTWIKNDFKQNYKFEQLKKSYQECLNDIEYYKK